LILFTGQFFGWAVEDKFRRSKCRGKKTEIEAKSI